MIQLRAGVPCWLEDMENGLTLRFRRMLRGLWLDLMNLELRVKELDQEIEIAAATNPVATRLQQLRGVGPIIATAIVANVGDAKQFSSGRQMAASLGLTPRQNSSGGKERLLGITKRGDAQLRTLLIHGARSVLRTAASKNDRMSRWVTHIAQTRHHNIAAVALANKTARIAWAMMTKGTDYQPGLGGGLSREQSVRKKEYPTTIAKQAVDGQQVEPALAEPENVCGLRARSSDREPARE